MKDDSLIDYMMVYIEKENAEKIASNIIIDNFYFMKYRSFSPLKSNILALPLHTKSVHRDKYMNIMVGTHASTTI